MAEPGLLIHYNNALAHATFSVQQFLAAKCMAVMPHPCYPPQLPAIYSCFKRMQLQLQWHHFHYTPEIQEPSLAILHKIPKSLVQQWQKCWNHCINLEWNYCEGSTTNNRDMNIFCHSVWELLDMPRCMTARIMESAKFWHPTGCCCKFRSPAWVSSTYCAWQIWQHSQLCCL